jgi:putative SOS response-associated peptidase YedK
MAVVHNSKKRMPAILSKSEENQWLDLAASASVLSGLLKPYPSDALKAHTISRLINDRTANRNTPDVIRPYDYNSGKYLF